ncbi:hypothetical protein [Nocardia sp. NBC_01329]|uniref:hypothetical protein n=1 Tax=Nocardia sp. NBC_01329 TaxID=2903594 RepID=UPI002E0DD817|nr:hypothetical protein OG405_05385 [Nocardia sp. NBC_01329]
MGSAVGTHGYADIAERNDPEGVEHLMGQLRALDKLLVGTGLPLISNPKPYLGIALVDDHLSES